MPTPQSPPHSGWRLAVARTVFFLILVETLFSVPYRSLALASHSHLLPYLAAAGLLLVAAACFVRRAVILAALSRFTPNPNPSWFPSWLVVGLVIRLIWALSFPITLKSDAEAYFSGAKSLAEQHVYGGAFWPPGFSLFLTPFFMLLGAHIWVTILVSLLLFMATYTTTAALTRTLAPPEYADSAARLACIFVTLWPTYWTLTEVNAKETLLALTVTGALLLYLKATDPGRPRTLLLIPAGMLLGLSALTQPSFLLFPSVILLIEIFRGTSLLRSLLPALLRTALFGAAMLLVILPWTARNYRTYHRVVLISTNGGSVFYRANNPRANANYSDQGEEALPKDEFAADAEGYRAAHAWIHDHPLDFAALMIRKQVNFLGDDGIGPYESLKRNLTPNPKFYAAMKGLANGYWLALWLVLLVGAQRLFRLPDWPLWFGVCFLPFLYQWAIDAVFESGGRHHVVFIPVLSALAALVLAAPVISRKPPAPARSL